MKSRKCIRVLEQVKSQRMNSDNIVPDSSVPSNDANVSDGKIRWNWWCRVIQSASLY